MSRAFVREEDLERPDQPPDFAISRHPNWVTARGLALIAEKLAATQAALAAGPTDAEKARLERDRRYWLARQASAQVRTPDPKSDEVGFGARVTLARDGRAPETIMLVGEDEADPAQGLISAFAPFAQALMEAREGDEIDVGPPARQARVRVVKVENG